MWFIDIFSVETWETPAIWKHPNEHAVSTSWRKDKEHYWICKKKNYPKICNRSDFVTNPSLSCVFGDFITLVMLHKVLMWSCIILRHKWHVVVWKKSVISLYETFLFKSNLFWSPVILYTVMNNQAFGVLVLQKMY